MRKDHISSGQSLIEFALLLPLLFIMIMGLFDIGRAILYYAVLNSAVREGTRFAIVQPHCDYKSNPGTCSGSVLDSYPIDCNHVQSAANINICQIVRDRFFNIDELSTSTITLNQQIVGSDNRYITINIQHLFRPITPGLGLIDNIQMRVDSQMLMAPIAKP